jgi:hypothetical protein
MTPKEFYESRNRTGPPWDDLEAYEQVYMATLAERAACKTIVLEAARQYRDAGWESESIALFGVAAKIKDRW